MTDLKVNGGFKLVPVEPTRDILARIVGAVDIHDEDGSVSCLSYEEAAAIYRAALTAEPEAKS